MAGRKYVVPHGQGSFYQRQSDGMWVGVIEAGWNSKGRRRRITVTAKDKARAWDKFTARRKRIMIEGITPDGVRAGATVEAWVSEWLKEREKNVRPKTYAGERATLHNWVLPTIGRRKLTDLGPADMRRLTDAMEAAGKSSTYARKAQMILQQALRDAVLEGHTVPDRALLAKRPSKAVSTRTDIPIEDAIRLLQAAEHTPQPARWVAALLQGMRQGEVLGLTWGAVNLDAGTIDVSWQLQDLRYADKDKGTFIKPRGYEARQIWNSYHLVRPKTRKGYRIMPLVPWMYAAIYKMKEDAVAAGTYTPDALVFPRFDGSGLPQWSGADREAWKTLQDAAGVRKGEDEYYVLHEARHTTASILLALDIDPTVITAIMGHSDYATTQGYQHVNLTMIRQALERAAEKLQLGM